MMRRRRRPLRRAAMVGGVAYHAGTNTQRAGEPSAPAPAPAAGPAPTGALSDAAMDQLKQLAELKDSGVLTQEEFDDQKGRILQGV